MISAAVDRPAETLTRRMLSKQVSTSLGMCCSHVDEIIVCTLAVIRKRLCEGEKIKLENFGKFEVKHRKGWDSRHPATGQENLVRARKMVRFNPGKGLKRWLAQSGKTLGGERETKSSN